MVKNAKEELKRFSQRGFQEMFPADLQLLEEVYICIRGQFEGNIA